MDNFDKAAALDFRAIIASILRFLRDLINRIEQISGSLTVSYGFENQPAPEEPAPEEEGEG